MRIGFKRVLAAIGLAALREIVKELRARAAGQAAQVPPAPSSNGSSPVARDSFEAAGGTAGAPVIDSRPASQLPSRAPVFTGFDAQKLAADLVMGADGRPKSAKYTFAKLAQAAGKMPQSKAEAEAWFKQYIQPGMEQAGFQVSWVSGDKAMIHTRENPRGEVVDFVRGAGSNDPSYIALAWQPTGEHGNGPRPPEPTDPTPPTGPGGAPTEPGAPLSTVPMLPHYATAPIDKGSLESAVKSAARWVKEQHPDWFAVDDRQVAYRIMTEVIGALRAAGYDAHRVVNHPSRAVGDGWRYGSDAVVINGKIFDAYRGIGDPNASVPQALYVGDYAPGRLRE
ncbi:MAG: hypothetical protein HYZ28_00205 [Myxococcales bacterium]|nr:hypothetical protein [Myxococcales bacterium]